MIWIYISESLLYLCFSLLMGAFIIQFIPERLKPEIRISKRLLQLAVLGIVFFSAAPLIRVILFLYEDIGLLLTMQNVLTGFEVGKAWTVTLILALFFYLFVSLFSVLNSKVLSGISLAFTFILLLALGWASHGASLTEWSGFVSHSLHFLAVTVWIGILLIVGWCSKNQENWLSYLRWFTPLAITCFLTIVGTGLFLMTLVIDVNEYGDAWMLPYGQALLVKHLTIIPVLFFAFINGFWIKRKLKRQEPINPIPWLKFESVLLFFTFVSTGVLGQQEPPHSIEITLAGSGPSAYFEYFYLGVIEPSMSLQFGFNTLNILFFIVAMIFMGLIVYSFKKKTPAIVPFFMGIFSVLSLYFGFMSSMQ
ncbi:MULTISPECIES: copper resistance D family protein [unclassified Sporosarcina]|uniref:copper resistance D family protein n=1 Tax=unclassified Sporosarcina TaxID=2647733 RepID=UPI000C1708FD|nr:MULTISPECIES: CopD family protein [unclassified Sporosarcina]PID04653.1 copper resistance protein CopD [Sporosarcina sp. P30]PID07760.1 copper resistance protein CopD [Sporosarcina sp. P31]PID10993.1 copper resistance protein CopD [Sporosarcina sp. P32b]